MKTKNCRRKEASRENSWTQFVVDFFQESVKLLKNVSSKSGLGSTWFVRCENENCPLQITNEVSRSQCRRRVALGTGVRQVNHSEALGGQQDSMAFIKIRLVRLFTALAVKTRKKRAIFTSEETKTTIMLRARKKKEKQTTEFTSVTYV